MNSLSGVAILFLFHTNVIKLYCETKGKKFLFLLTVGRTGDNLSLPSLYNILILLSSLFIYA